jgi:hypothetical protein
MPDLKITEDSVQQLFSTLDLSTEEKRYLDYHTRRLAYSTTKVQELVSTSETPVKILDIGPHFLTYCLLHLVQPKPQIYTMGFVNEHLFPSHLAEKHFELDLNNCESVPADTIGTKFDLIVFSETIEHLYTSPKIVLGFLSGLLSNRQGAGILIQTPNAAFIRKRIQLLFGRNPYELIRTDRTNPGHFREYTMAELIKYGTEAGFTIGPHEYCNYWTVENPLFRLSSIIPSFRLGMTIFLKK